jgi:hypothetical protein
MSFTWVSSSVGQLSDTDPDPVIKVAQKREITVYKTAGSLTTASF